MNKEILFKAKQKNSEIWVESPNIIQGELNTYFKHPLKSGQWIEVDPTTLCRFSGVLDKSGECLFTSDIICVCNAEKYYSKKLIVTFEDGSFCLRIPGTEDFSDAVTFRNSLYQAMQKGQVPVYEKLGNIFDNPELLK